MSIVNRRNAMIGWLTWTVAKRMAAKKAKTVVPSRGSTGRKKAVKVTAAVVATTGAVAFWRAKHRDSTDHDSLAAEDLDVGSDAPIAE
jgi:hypothetical protein